MQTLRLDICKFHGCAVDERFKRINRIDRGKHKSAADRKRELSQIITLGWKIFDAFKLRHRQKFAVERKSPTMVRAADQIGLAGLFDQYFPSMRTDVREARKRFIRLYNQNRFVEKSGQDRRRL